MWSCDFDREKVVNPPLQKYICKLNIPKTIDIRDSYFGERTNGIKLLKEMKENEKGGYVDFCSLYPDVLKYQKYPTGHPICIVDNFLPIHKDMSWISLENPLIGIIKAKILPPARLLCPILPIWVNGKLMFPLHIKC